MNQTLALWSLFAFGIVVGAVVMLLAGLWFLWDDSDPFGGEK